MCLKRHAVKWNSAGRLICCCQAELDTLSIWKLNIFAGWFYFLLSSEKRNSSNWASHRGLSRTLLSEHWAITLATCYKLLFDTYSVWQHYSAADGIRVWHSSTENTIYFSLSHLRCLRNALVSFLSRTFRWALSKHLSILQIIFIFSLHHLDTFWGDFLDLWFSWSVLQKLGFPSACDPMVSKIKLSELYVLAAKKESLLCRSVELSSCVRITNAAHLY